LRVTQRLLVDRVLGNLSANTRRLLKLQEQLATQQRVNRPSDDPLGARRGINARDAIAANDQYLTNISTVGPLLLETETAVLTVTDVLRRARELATQGATGTNGQAQRDQIAIEVSQIIESVLNQGNLNSNGRFIFGGTRTSNPPFVATRNAGGEVTAVAYEGNDEKIEIEISDGVRVSVNETGQDVFRSNGLGSVDIFQTLIDLRDRLRAGDVNGLQSSIGDLGTAQEQLLVATARMGATDNRIQRVDANIQDIKVQLLQVLSDAIDADFTEVTLELNAESNAYQAALNAASRVIQPSLLNFLQ